MRHLRNFSILFLAFLSGLYGILLFRGISRDFSPFDPSYQMILQFLGSAALITFGIYLGFHAFKKMKGS